MEAVHACDAGTHTPASPASVRCDEGTECDQSARVGVDGGVGSDEPVVACWKVHRWQRGNQVRLVLLLAIVGGLVALLTAVRTWDYISEFSEWCKKNQATGSLILIGAYIIATVLAFPAAVLTIVGGFIFGVWVGSAAVLAGATSGACLAFLCGRYIFADAVRRRIKARHRKIDIIFGVIEKQAFKITFLLRLSPIVPFNALNYALGITDMSFLSYSVASLFGMIPGTILYCYVGSTLKSVGDIAAGNMQRTPEQEAFFWCGLAASIVVALGISFYARREMAKALAEANNGDQADVVPPPISQDLGHDSDDRRHLGDEQPFREGIGQTATADGSQND